MNPLSNESLLEHPCSEPNGGDSCVTCASRSVMWETDPACPLLKRPLTIPSRLLRNTRPGLSGKSKLEQARSANTAPDSTITLKFRPWSFSGAGAWNLELSSSCPQFARFDRGEPHSYFAPEPADRAGQGRESKVLPAAPYKVFRHKDHVRACVFIEGPPTVPAAGLFPATLIMPDTPLQFPSADAFLAAIINSSEDAIISKSLEGIVTSWNPGAERIFGYTAAEMVGQPISKIIPPERGAEEPDILKRIGRGERVEHFETKRVRKDGRTVDVSLTISPIKDQNGKLVGASKIA